MDSSSSLASSVTPVREPRAATESENPAKVAQHTAHRRPATPEKPHRCPLSQLYLLAYGRIYANQGVMTPGPRRKLWMACHWPRSIASSMRCATSATGSGPSAGCTSRKEGEDAPARQADLVRQARRRSGPPAVRGVLNLVTVLLLRQPYGRRQARSDHPPASTVPCGLYR